MAHAADEPGEEFQAYSDSSPPNCGLPVGSLDEVDEVIDMLSDDVLFEQQTTKLSSGRRGANDQICEDHIIRGVLVQSGSFKK